MTFTPDLTQYPPRVVAYTTLIPEPGYMAFARLSFCFAEVHYHEESGYGFYHEMGHASAWILGIEQDLGNLVMRQPNAKNPKNDNIFCYGAQRLEAHYCETAIAEYAATAIEYYICSPRELPRPVYDFIHAHWAA